MAYDRAMLPPDLNLLIALEALLAEGNVARAARRLRLSPSAMSRTLARLRDVTGDPLLVRAGRGLVPTPHALELRDRVGPALQGVLAVLRPSPTLDLARVERVFTLRNADGFVDNFGAALLNRVRAQAPGVVLRFVPKSGQDGSAFRDGGVDLETAVVWPDTWGDLRTQALFRDRFIGVVRPDHPLAAGAVSAPAYAACAHVVKCGAGPVRGPVDDALESLGLRRSVAATVAGFAAALALARDSDLVATVPDRHTLRLRDGLYAFDLPFAVPALTVSMLWHPRLDADPVHRWLRSCMKEVCG